jgi:CHAT domain-containing protein
MRHEITYTPSASVLAALHLPRPDRPEPTGELALVGDAISLFDDERLLSAPAFAGRQLGVTRFDKGFERLPDAATEIRSIVPLVRGRVKTLLGFEATRDRIIEGALNGFRVLHFSTHGVADPEEAGRAAIVLSWYDRSGKRLDAFLRARDVDKLKLSAELVVLSACETGLGEMVRGEGLVGLPQSFLAAGASNVVVSLGRVPDDSTSHLMQRFYLGMYEHGLTVPDALRQAQIALIRDPAFSAPYHWAGFVVQGAGTRPPRPPRPAARD